MTIAGKLAATGGIFFSFAALGVMGVIATDLGLGPDGDSLRCARWKRATQWSSITGALLCASGAFLAAWSS
jgi:hypothetical protein